MERLKELSGVGREAGFIFEAMGKRFVSAVLDQLCCTVVKRGNLLLRMRQGCVGWCVVRSGCVG